MKLLDLCIQLCKVQVLRLGKFELKLTGHASMAALEERVELNWEVNVMIIVLMVVIMEGLVIIQSILVFQKHSEIYFV